MLITQASLGGERVIVKIKDCRLSFLYFLFELSFIFLFLETLGLGLEMISHTVTSVTSDSAVTTLITGLKRRK